MDLDPDLLAIGTTPISAGQPAGESARYEPEFEQLAAEIAKLEALDGGTVDWALVADHARTLLQRRSKDLLLASYLAAGLYQQRGYPGLADGLNLIKALLATFWDTAFPGKDRLRARRTTLEWLIERVKGWVEHSAPSTADMDAMATCTALLGEIVVANDGRWEGEDPPLWSLQKAIQAKIEALKAAPPAAPDGDQGDGDPVADAPRQGLGATGIPSHPAPRPTPRGATADPISIGGIASRDDAYRALADIAAFLRASEPHSPVPYLIQRAVSWGSRPLADVLAELLKHSDDARNHVWETLALDLAVEPEKPVAKRTRAAPAQPAAAEPAKDEEPAGDY